MKKPPIIFFILTLAFGTAWAGVYEDGVAAHARNDYVTALNLWRPLAEKGDAFVQSLIGSMYRDGEGVAQDFKEAVKWYRLAADQGKPLAQNHLGRMYADGHGVTQDHKEAVRWYRLAANQGYAGAQTNLGVMYNNGDGVTQDYKEATKWYRLAAEQGETYAQLYLGVMYQYNHGVSNHQKLKDSMFGAFDANDQLLFDDALKWFNKALNAGNTGAYVRIGRLYLYGVGSVHSDPIRAVPYLDKANQVDSSDKSVFKDLAKIYSDIVFNDNQLSNSQWMLTSGYSKFYDAKLVDAKLRERAEEFIMKLRNSDDVHWYLHAMKAANGGYKSPSNKQLALELVLLGLQKNDKYLEDEFIRDVFILMSENEFKENKYLYYAWLLKMSSQFIAYSDSDMRASAIRNLDSLKMPMHTEISALEISEIKEIGLQDLVNKTLGVLYARRKLIGNIEPSDYLQEALKAFTGADGRKINEPLAQHLTEESLRLALRVKNEELINEARNNLGVILLAAVNNNVRNERLALVHLIDGVDSTEGPTNILWQEYLGKITLSFDEKIKLKEKYKKGHGDDHPSSKLRQLTDAQKANPANVDAFIQSIKHPDKFTHNIETDKDIERSAPSIVDMTMAIAFAQYYEQQINLLGVDKAIEAYKQALLIANMELYKGGDPIHIMFTLTNLKLRIQKLERIKLGDYEKGTPDTTAQISEIFKDLDSIRGVSKVKNIAVDARPPIVNNELKLYALVMGNSAYKKQPLINSVNDANLMSTKLTEHGFKVIKILNADRKKFSKSLINFAVAAKDADVVVLFYAGHAVQLGGLNYLLPTDIDLDEPENIVTFEGINVNNLLRGSLPGKSRIIFLDACRASPFSAGQTRGVGDGLAPPMNVATGTLISYATRDGGVAYDGNLGSANSPYTQALAKFIGRDDDIALLLREVRDEVVAKTNGKQEPWEYGALSGGRLVISKLAKSKPH